MFEKIGRYAESAASAAGQSRRGFLGRLSKGALGAAGLVGGLLLLPREAPATTTGDCVYCCPDSTTVSHGCPCKPSIKHNGMICGLCEKSCGY
jgi:hypothetical protein